VRPEVSRVIGALSQAGVGERLAGIPACKYVNGLHAGEVQLGYVAVVRYAGEVMVKDARRGLVVLHMPGNFSAQHLPDGQVEAAVAGEQGTDTHPVTVAPKSYPRRVALSLM
jgi:hypothetical protein